MLVGLRRRGIGVGDGLIGRYLTIGGLRGIGSVVSRSIVIAYRYIISDFSGASVPSLDIALNVGLTFDGFVAGSDVDLWFCTGVPGQLVFTHILTISIKSINPHHISLMYCYRLCKLSRILEVDSLQVIK